MVDTIAKKKLKSDGIFLVGQNSKDVTGSEILIRFNGKQILLECGLYQNNSYLDSYKINSEKFKFEPSEIDYCFVNHCHIDHCGKLPRLVKEGFKGKVIMSYETAMLSKALLSNCAFILDSEARMLSKKFGRNYSPIYTEDDVHRTIDFVYDFDDCNKIYKLDDVVSFQWLKNSHCVGARQLQLILTDKNGAKTSILYTSDIGALDSKNNYVENTEIPSTFNKITIMESTYGERGRIHKKSREFDVEHLRVAINTVMERGGTVLLPCFSFSRTQQLLTNLYEIYHDNVDFKYDVIIDSKLSCEISELYGKILNGDDLKFWNKVSSWENVKFIEDKEESTSCIKDKRPKIVISSSGFCTNGRILNYLQEYLKDDKSMVVFSGYVGADNSYLSYRIKNYNEHKTININKKPIANKADCITLSTFSSHASREDLIKYGSSINTEKLILVHGSEKAKLELKEDLEKAISKQDKSFKVICSTKDMVVHL
jgi:metallo-beta-lactamase family protein